MYHGRPQKRTVERWERGLLIKCHRGQRSAKCAGDAFCSVFLLQDEPLYVINRDELVVIFLNLFFILKVNTFLEEKSSILRVSSKFGTYFKYEF